MSIRMKINLPEQIQFFLSNKSARSIVRKQNLGASLKRLWSYCKRLWSYCSESRRPNLRAYFFKPSLQHCVKNISKYQSANVHSGNHDTPRSFDFTGRFISKSCIEIHARKKLAV